MSTPFTTPKADFIYFGFLALTEPKNLVKLLVRNNILEKQYPVIAIHKIPNLCFFFSYN